MNAFYVPTKIYTGEAAFENLKQYPIHNLCIICDPFVEKSGMVNKLLRVLDEMGAQYRIFSDITPDPNTELVVQGLSRIVAHKPDAVLAMGGGSAIDAAKAISYMYQKTTGAEKPLCIAVPTTSGTGSEATSFAVITDAETHIKYPITDDKRLPNIAILDPTLVRSVPPAVTADTGMDVLTHAIEAYVSTGANDFSDALAEKAVRLVVEYLPWVYKHGDDMAAREHMHNASNMAGIAFNHASLGINHSIAHIVGGRFRIPHGRANAIVLPYVIEFNSRLGDRTHAADSMAAMKYSQLGVLIGGGSYAGPQAIRNLIITIEKMQAEFDIPSSLKKAGVDQQAFMSSVEELAEIAIQDKCTATNPRSVSKKRMVELLKRIYNGR